MYVMVTIIEMYISHAVNDDCSDNERYCQSSSTCQEGADGDSYCKVKGETYSNLPVDTKLTHFSSTVGEDCNGADECVDGAECGMGGTCILIRE